GTMLVATAPGAARMPSHAARPASAISNGVTVPRPTRKSVEVRREHWFVAPVREPEKAILLVNRPLRDSFAAPSVEGAIVSGSAMRSSDWSSVASEQTRRWIELADSGTALADGAKRAGYATGIGVRT